MTTATKETKVGGNAEQYGSERRRLLERAIDANRMTSAEVTERFGDGTLGQHELTDRAYMVRENWDRFVLEHPSCLLYPHLFEKVVAIDKLLWDFYQSAGNEEGCGADRAEARVTGTN